MKIEITVEGQEPTVHKLTKEKTLLGAGQDCDIPVTAEGISRKHLMIIAENDQYFVVDQGSTNGSFINEDRMVPGQRTGFTSFFPVKMGFYVTVALLSDDEGGGSFDFAKTLNKSSEPAKPKAAAPTKTDIQTPRGRSSGGGTSPKITLQKNPKDKKERPGAPGKRGGKAAEESGSQSIKLIAFLIAVGGTLGLWYLTKEEEAPPVVEQTVVVDQTPQVNLAEVDFPLPEMVGADTAPNAFSDQKCVNELAKEFCNAMNLPRPNYPMSGVVFTTSSIVFVLPAHPAGEHFPAHREYFGWKEDIIPRIGAVDDPRDQAAFYLMYMKPELWGKLSPERRWLYVVFVSSSGQRQGMTLVADGLAIKQMNAATDYIGNMKQIRESGLDGLGFMSGFLREAPQP